MPVTPTYPGVYIEEVPSGVRTIMGVSTAIAAFFGQAREGPVNKAVRLLSYADFERNFGAPHSSSELGTAVRLFYQNGGADCYVVRLVKKGTGKEASLVIKNETSSLDVLKFSAKEIGVWGNELAIEIDPLTGQPEETFHIRVYRLALDGSIKTAEEFLNCSMDIDSPRFPPNLLTQDLKLVNCKHAFASDNDYKTVAASAGYSEARQPFANSQAGRDELAGLLAAASNSHSFRLSVDGGPYYEVKLDDAFAAGASEIQATTAIKARINTALPPALVDKVTPTFEQITTAAPHQKVLRLTSATSEKKSIQVLPAASKDASKVLMLGVDQGGIERSRDAPLRPAPSGIFLRPDKINELANFPQNHFNSLTLDGAAISLGTSLETTGAADAWYKGLVSPGVKNADGVREKLAILAKTINDAGIGWDARTSGYQLVVQKRSAPSFFLGTYATTPNAITSLGANTRRYALGIGVGSFQAAAQAGVEGDPPDAPSFTGSETEHTGFYALDTVDLFNLMVIPKDAMLSENDIRSLWGPASSYCKARRAFSLIDPPDSWKTYSDVTDATKGIRKLRNGVVKDYSAVFFPKLKLRESGVVKTVGPAGAIAGLMSRIDAGRGVWKAPAGTEASLVGVDGLEVMLTDMENGVLNKEGVNCLRVFPGGTVNWGGRTLDGADDFASEWKYIPIRRLALLIEESLYRGTQWVVFEPNDEPLWAQIRLNVGAFMHTLFRQGAFQGISPREAYFVRCDKDTTTQTDRNMGVVNILVGFAPLKPAEFVIIKIQQIAGQIQA